MGKRLNYDDRLLIEQGLANNIKVSEIAKKIGCVRATVYAELKKNEKPYCAEDAQRKLRG